MNTERLADAGTKLDEIWQQIFAHLQTLSDPVRQRRLKQGLVAVAAVWMVFALVNLVWSLVPAPGAPPAPGNVINPLVEAAAASGRKPVNIDEMAGWSLFGTATSTPTRASGSRSRAKDTIRSAMVSARRSGWPTHTASAKRSLSVMGSSLS